MMEGKTIFPFQLPLQDNNNEKREVNAVKTRHWKSRQYS